ncbi:hypothetical protein FRB90_003144, partial [Tulasnella sp. 427]
MVIEKVLGEGVPWKVETKPGADGIWQVDGYINGVKVGGEMSWSLEGCVAVKYFLRVVYRHKSIKLLGEQMVQLVTDELGAIDVEAEEDAWERPQLGLLNGSCDPTAPGNGGSWISHFGDVFRGRHQKYGLLALKRLRIGLEDDNTEGVRRFSREGETWQNLEHPNVLPFLGADSVGDSIYLISPFAEHGTIIDYLKRYPLSDRTKFLRDIASAIGFLHSSGIIHGDIKGRNVLISPNLDAQVCDFGLARYADVSTSTNMKGAGTIRWSSPEILCGQQRSYASDVYAYGMTIAEILSGEPPFSRFKDNVAVITAVLLRNMRPDRVPLTSIDGTSYEKEWDIAERC